MDARKRTADLPSGPLTYRETGAGDAIVFLHGLAGNSLSWVGQFERFSLDHRCIAWDAPGYGGSVLAEPDADRFAETLTHLFEHCAVDRATVVGHSMGGIVSARFAGRHPEYVERLVLSCTHWGGCRPKGSGLSDDYRERLQAFDRGGTIDKIVGDAVVVLFNAPIGQDDHRQRAALCAMEFDKFARAFQARNREQGIEIGGTRVGVNSGMVTVGNFGGKAFFDYTAHGDAMNTGARLESVNKQTGTMVCIAEETMKGVVGMRARPIGRLVLKGKTQGVLTYEPVDHLPEDQVAAYEAAYDLLKEEHADAPKAFEELAASYPDDKLVTMHAGRLAGGATGETIVLKEK